MDPNSEGEKIFEAVAGAHVFRVNRTKDMALQFWYSSPGTGTRIAVIDLSRTPHFLHSKIGLSWSPEQISFAIEPLIKGVESLGARGTESAINLRAGRDGQIYWIGSEAAEVTNVRLNVGGKEVIRPAAIEAWKSTLQAITILTSGSSDEGYIYEVVTTNLIVAMLVTGMEAYLKTRFLELEQEGIEPDVESLVASFWSEREKESNIFDRIAADASDANHSILEHIVKSRRINFQSYIKTKRAYSKAYGLTHKIVGLDSKTIDTLKQILNHRHRVVHVSPTVELVNESSFPAEAPIFPNSQYGELAIETCTMFVNKWHDGSLKLRN